MVEIPPDLFGRDFDFGPTTVTEPLVRRYAETVGDEETLSRLGSGDEVAAPPTFVLALHRGMRPEVVLPPDHFGVYGGHDINLFAPICVGRSYRVSARLAGSFEKSGRSGTLTVVEREGVIREETGEVAARIRERQIVRRRPSAEAPRGATRLPGSPTAATPDPAPAPAHAAAPRQIELGSELGPLRRPATPAEQVGRYVAGNEMREGLFTDPEFARRLGYRGIVVPGPMLTAFLEHFLRSELRGWRLESLATTFRMPTITGDELVLSGVVSEHEDERVVCDVVIEHAGGERAVTAVARLFRGAASPRHGVLSSRF